MFSFLLLSKPTKKLINFFSAKKRHPLSLSGFHELFEISQKNPIAHFDCPKIKLIRAGIYLNVEKKFMAVSFKQFVCIDFDLIVLILNIICYFSKMWGVFHFAADRKTRAKQHFRETSLHRQLRQLFSHIGIGKQA